MLGVVWSIELMASILRLVARSSLRLGCTRTLVFLSRFAMIILRSPLGAAYIYVEKIKF